VSMALGTATAAPHDRLEPAIRLADARMYADKRAASGEVLSQER